MPRKVVFLADPGIDTAVALGLALKDPQLEVLAFLATGGNVDYLQATQNLHVLLNELDPPKWPRVGGAMPVEYPFNGRNVHGPDGLGNVGYPAVSLHSPTAGDKLLHSLIQEHPGEITVVALGPLTTLACLFERHPDAAGQLDRVIVVGGTWFEQGNAGTCTELRFACDPASARRVLHSGVSLVLLPLDVTRKILLSPTDIRELPGPASATTQFFKAIIPFGLHATAQVYGVEGLYLNDVLGLFAVSNLRGLTLKSAYVDVETRGELTSGMIVIDPRPKAPRTPNVQLATGVDPAEVHVYMNRLMAAD